MTDRCNARERDRQNERETDREMERQRERDNTVLQVRASEKPFDKKLDI